MANDLRNEKGQLAASVGVLLTAGTNQEYQINKIDLYNGSGSDVADIEFHIVPDGGTASAANKLYSLGSLVAGAPRNIPLSGHTLYNGDTLQAVAGTGSAVNYIVSYQKISG